MTLCNHYHSPTRLTAPAHYKFQFEKPSGRISRDFQSLSVCLQQIRFNIGCSTPFTKPTSRTSSAI